MNIADDFPKKADLIAEAKKLIASRVAQIRPDRNAVYEVIADIETALAVTLHGLAYTPAAKVCYATDLDRPYDYFSLTIILQCTPADFATVKQQIAPWKSEKMFPLKFPSTKSRQNTIGCMEIYDHGDWDESEGESNPLPDNHSLALCFQFVEW